MFLHLMNSQIIVSQYHSPQPRSSYSKLLQPLQQMSLHFHNHLHVMRDLLDRLAVNRVEITSCLDLLTMRMFSTRWTIPLVSMNS